MKSEIIEFFQSISVEEIHVLDPSIRRAEYRPIDLSISNKDLANYNLASSAELQLYVDSVLSRVGGKVGYGGYLERRGIYRRSDHFNKVEEPSLERNIHLGIDLWCEKGTSVHACYNGVIHSFQYNSAYGDYGPTIILEHKNVGYTWYSLYGHLSIDSLDNLIVGKKIAMGERIGSLGGPDVNGDYPPHLHFQLILNMEGKKGDYPGVSSEADLEYYQFNCPDPGILLKLT